MEVMQERHELRTNASTQPRPCVFLDGGTIGASRESVLPTRRTPRGECHDLEITFEVLKDHANRYETWLTKQSTVAQYD